VDRLLVHYAFSRRRGVILAEGTGSGHKSPIDILSYIRHELFFDLRQPGGVHARVKVGPLPAADNDPRKERLHDRPGASPPAGGRGALC
jgi:hypothetical protein